MTIVVRNPIYRLIAIAVSLIIVAVLYFGVFKPNQDTANTAVKQSEQQVQQAVNLADQQSGGAVPQGVKDLTSCMAAAGSDTGKIQACAAKYH